jgi:hypothetical protein
VLPFGAAFTLAAALAIPIVWNLAIWVIHRLAELAVNESGPA